MTLLELLFDRFNLGLDGLPIAVYAGFFEFGEGGVMLGEGGFLGGEGLFEGGEIDDSSIEILLVFKNLLLKLGLLVG